MADENNADNDASDGGKKSSKIPSPFSVPPSLTNFQRILHFIEKIMLLISFLSLLNIIFFPEKKNTTKV